MDKTGAMNAELQQTAVRRRGYTPGVNLQWSKMFRTFQHQPLYRGPIHIHRFLNQCKWKSAHQDIPEDDFLRECCVFVSLQAGLDLLSIALSLSRTLIPKEDIDETIVDSSSFEGFAKKEMDVSGKRMFVASSAIRNRKQFQWNYFCNTGNRLNATNTKQFTETCQVLHTNQKGFENQTAPLWLCLSWNSAALGWIRLSCLRTCDKQK